MIRSVADNDYSHASLGFQPLPARRGPGGRVAGICLLSFLPWACEAAPSTPTTSDTPDAQTDSGVVSSVGGGGGTASTSTGGQGGGRLPADSGLGDSSSTEDTGPLPDGSFTYNPGTPPESGVLACTSTYVDAVPRPLDVYIMLDRSASMLYTLPSGGVVSGDCDIPGSIGSGAGADSGLDGGGSDAADSGTDPDWEINQYSQWCRAITALDSFFEHAPAGTGVALNFFPNGTCDTDGPSGDICCDDGSCCYGGLDEVPEVGLGELPEHRSALQAALNAQVPLGTKTPIQPALRGLSRWTAANRRPLRTMISVWGTDGAPLGCAVNPYNLALVASEHLADTGLYTFVIGIEGANFSALERIAEAGGGPLHTDHCPDGVNPCFSYDGTPVGNDASILAVALARIQSGIVACEFDMPPDPDAGLIDLSKVTVEYSREGQQTSVFEQRMNLAECAGAGGFYYDDEQPPTTISLCPASCSTVQQDANGRVQVSLGCLGA